MDEQYTENIDLYLPNNQRIRLYLTRNQFANIDIRSVSESIADALQSESLQYCRNSVFEASAHSKNSSNDDENMITSNGKRHYCSFNECDKRYVRISHLKAHVRQHRGE